MLSIFVSTCFMLGVGGMAIETGLGDRSNWWLLLEIPGTLYFALVTLGNVLVYKGIITV